MSKMFRKYVMCIDFTDVVNEHHSCGCTYSQSVCSSIQVSVLSVCIIIFSANLILVRIGQFHFILYEAQFELHQISPKLTNFADGRRSLGQPWSY
jgi:hypothetical protein